jgi:hypothetical protein
MIAEGDKKLFTSSGKPLTSFDNHMQGHRFNQSRSMVPPEVERFRFRQRNDDVTPMEVDATTSSRPFSPLTPAEKDRRRKEGLCMYCGVKGHIARACPRVGMGAKANATTAGKMLQEQSEKEIARK